MYLTNQFRSIPKGVFRSFAVHRTVLSISEREFWNRHDRLGLSGPYAVAAGILYSSDAEMFGTQGFREISSGSPTSMILSADNPLEMRLIEHLTRRALLGQLAALGVQRVSRIALYPTDIKYVQRIPRAEATYVSYRGFRPDVAVLSDTCDADIRFVPDGAFRIQIEGTQWLDWIGYEVKVVEESGLDSTRLYILESVDLATGKGSVSQGGCNSTVNLSELYVPASTSVLKRREVFEPMHGFRNYLDVPIFDILELFLGKIASHDRFRILYSKNPLREIEFERVSEKEERTKW